MGSGRDAAPFCACLGQDFGRLLAGGAGPGGRFDRFGCRWTGSRREWSRPDGELPGRRSRRKAACGASGLDGLAGRRNGHGAGRTDGRAQPPDGACGECRERGASALRRRRRGARAGWLRALLFPVRGGCAKTGRMGCQADCRRAHCACCGRDGRVRDRGRGGRAPVSFRTRLVIGALVAAWVPVLSMGLLMRSVGADRLTEANERRVEERLDRIVRNWERDTDRMGERLDVLERLLSEDNAARIALRSREAGALQGAVGRFAASSGTTITYVTDPEGTILAASHFPGDAGRNDPDLAALADQVAGPVVARVPLPTGDVTALVRARRLDVGGVGAVAIVGAELGGLAAVQGDSEVSLLAVPTRGAATAPRGIAGDGSLAVEATGFQGRRPVARVAWQGWDGGTDIVPVDLVVAWQDPLTVAMVRSWDRALLFALAGSAVLALLIGMAMARRLSSPVEKLTATARRVHLGRLDVTFTRGGARELDRLGFFLNGMLGRIREGLARVRDAEKRATLGELARQVNHDVRNGLIPIRNVMRHLNEAHRTGAGALAETYEARAATVTESIDYLDELADQYQAVAVHGARERSDLRAVAHSVVEAGAG
ncbi:MAG: HAMP domain-containing protein, partial [Gemmatimonadetes bacterium]|nr:HAMP domain-containing protein [Gemmatimonadota bacterium]